MINKELKNYIEKNILPVYNNFDKGHNLDHIKAVIKRGLDNYEFLNDASININMVYTACAYHDFGIQIARKSHAKHSSDLLKADQNLQQWFNNSEIEIMAEACFDHSTSLNREPRTIYGKIVCDADKDNDVNVALSRAWEFTITYFPDLTENEAIEDCYIQLNKKFGDGGLVKYYINSDQNLNFIKTMNKLANNKELFTQKIKEIIKK